MKNVFTLKRTSKNNNQNHVKIELQATSAAVNVKLLPGDASIGIIDTSSMHQQR